MSEQSHTTPFYLLVPPYEALIPLDDASTIPKSKRPHQGVGLVWNMAAGDWGKMVALKGNDVVPVPLKDATQKLKTVPEDWAQLAEVFWK